MAAVSVGVIHNRPLLDLDYSEDSQADVDLNVVMNGEGHLLELQGTAEGAPFSRDQLNNEEETSARSQRLTDEISEKADHNNGIGFQTLATTHPTACQSKTIQVFPA